MVEKEITWSKKCKIFKYFSTNFSVLISSDQFVEFESDTI